LVLLLLVSETHSMQTPHTKPQPPQLSEVPLSTQTPQQHINPIGQSRLQMAGGTPSSQVASQMVAVALGSQEPSQQISSVAQVFPHRPQLK
jgi:hypothetical protein